MYIVECQILAPLRNMIFTSLDEINAEIKKRLSAANSQLFQKMKTSRLELFEQLDKEILKRLPPARYQYATWNKATINVDYHFVFEDCHYSVPYQYIGKKIEVRATNKSIESFHDNQRIATHVRSHKKYSFATAPDHMPKNHQEYAKFSPNRLHNWAASIGENTGKFMQYMISSRAFQQQACRACLGLLRLAKHYGAMRLDKACYKALLVGATRYQQVESILKNNLEGVQVQSKIKDMLLITHENICDQDYYQ